MSFISTLARSTLQRIFGVSKMTDIKTIEYWKERLAPVPSYEEWKTVFNYASKYEVEYVKCVNDYEELKNENQQLKELLKDCKEWFECFAWNKEYKHKSVNLLTRINAAIGESEE